MELHVGEIIRPIEGYEGLYSITSYGRIWSHEKTSVDQNGRKFTFRSKFMSPALLKNGYFQAQLSNLGEVKRYQVNCLVAAAFVENPNNYPQVNHKDGNKQNNYAGTLEGNFKDGNLEWCTRLQNQIHASVNGFWKNATSKYPGVSFAKGIKQKKKPWQVQFQMNNKCKSLGTFTTEQEAAKVYYIYVITNYPDAFDLVKDKLKDFYKGVIDFDNKKG